MSSPYEQPETNRVESASAENIHTPEQLTKELEKELKRIRETAEAKIHHYLLTIEDEAKQEAANAVLRFQTELQLHGANLPQKGMQPQFAKPSLPENETSETDSTSPVHEETYDTTNWQEQLPARLGAYQEIEQQFPDSQEVQMASEEMKKVASWLIDRWPAIVDKIKKGDTINLKPFMPTIDYALYTPMEELKMPRQEVAEATKIGNEIRELLVATQLVRRSEIEKLGMERIEAEEGTPRMYTDEWAVDNDADRPEAPRPSLAGMVYAVRPGKGGYRFNNKVVVPAYAVYYAS